MVSHDLRLTVRRAQTNREENFRSEKMDNIAPMNVPAVQFWASSCGVDPSVSTADSIAFSRSATVSVVRRPADISPSRAEPARRALLRCGRSRTPKPWACLSEVTMALRLTRVQSMWNQ